MPTLTSTILFALFLAAGPVRYEVRFDNADHHEAEVTVRFDDVPEGTLELRMSRSSPGRYALHEFAKNVYAVRAEDGRGMELSVTRPNPHQWDVTGHDGTVVVRYTIFGDRSDGTYLAVDNTHAHMNIPATFMWARGLGDRPVTLTIAPPKPGWRVATQLEPTDDPNVFAAPNLYYFLDSPTEVSGFELYEWRASSPGESYPIRLALHHAGTDEQGAVFARLAEAVVGEHAAMYRDLPDFDFGTYTFIADYLPYVNGDGMEHRNSTVLSSTRSLSDPLRNLGTVSHEFFHAWNVERMRPRSLEPFDFERANMSGELWFAEGFTSYYDDLAIKRAGIYSLERYARELASNVDPILNAPGRRFFSPIEMSQQAPFVDAATANDPTNRANTFASYYPYGAVVALSLDLSIRTRYSGRSLDDVMRAMWARHGKTEISYDVSDIESAIASVTDEGFASEFVTASIRGSELPDLEALLARAGLVLRKRNSGKPWLGASLGSGVSGGGGAQITSSALIGGPLYDAGADEGDAILELGGEPVSGADAFDTLRPGERTTIVFEKRGGERRRVEIVVAEDPALEIVTFEAAGRDVSPEVEAFRTAWLESTGGVSAEVERLCDTCGRRFGTAEEFCPYDGRALRLVLPQP